jgi:hypothetical protein
MLDPEHRAHPVEEFGLASAGQTGFFILHAQRTVLEPLARNQARRFRRTNLRLFLRMFVELSLGDATRTVRTKPNDEL